MARRAARPGCERTGGRDTGRKKSEHEHDRKQRAGGFHFARAHTTAVGRSTGFASQEDKEREQEAARRQGREIESTRTGPRSRELSTAFSAFWTLFAFDCLTFFRRMQGVTAHTWTGAWTFPRLGRNLGRHAHFTSNAWTLGRSVQLSGVRCPFGRQELHYAHLDVPDFVNVFFLTLGLEPRGCV